MLSYTSQLIISNNIITNNIDSLLMNTLNYNESTTHTSQSISINNMNINIRLNLFLCNSKRTDSICSYSASNEDIEICNDTKIMSCRNK